MRGMSWTACQAKKSAKMLLRAIMHRVTVVLHRHKRRGKLQKRVLMIGADR